MRHVLRLPLEAAASKTAQINCMCSGWYRRNPYNSAERSENMIKYKKHSPRRWGMMAVGILFTGICVGAYRLSQFGADAFTCMNLGISGFLGISFGTWQLIINLAILTVVFWKARGCIGPGTVANMVGVGYLADFTCWVVLDLLKVEMTLPLRIGALVLGSVLVGLGVGLYMAAEMGIAPYDSVGLIIEDMTGGRIPFRWARVISDVTAVSVGVIFCLLSAGNMGMILGVGTICGALFNGPLIQFFKTHVAEPMLGKD